MRYALILLSLIVLGSYDAPAKAAPIDPNKIALVDQAADEFRAREAVALTKGLVPRDTDLAVRRLLDTVFDTNELTHGPLPFTDFAKLNQSSPSSDPGPSTTSVTC